MNARLLPLGLVSLGLALPAAAQTTPPTPPDRVGRIAAITGSVSFRPGGGTQWQVASRNLPVTSGTALWVAPPAGEVAIGVADNTVVLAPSTELDVDQLDDQAMATTAPQGESYWHLRTVAAADTYTVHTPRGTVTMATAGRYEINCGDTGHPTTVTVLDGTATLSDVPTSQEIGPGQTLTLTGDGNATPFDGTIGPAVQDAFLRHVLAEEAPTRPRPAAAPAILSSMTGAEPLLAVGEWTENVEYGPVWYPPQVDYVPYRRGRWAYVAPWGWTWVDDAPWGFAPSHYGRWAQFGGRWGWVPGRDWSPGRPAVYAPALVGFLGAAALGTGRAGLTGWAPLGPREAYRPPYPVSDRTLEALNGPTGARFGGPVVGSFSRSAVTIVPTQILTTSAPVAGAFRRGVSIGADPVLQYRPELAPTRATFGVSRAELQRVNPAGLSAPGARFGAAPGLARPEPALPTVVSPGGPPAERRGALPDLRGREAAPGGGRDVLSGRPPLAEPGRDILSGRPAEAPNRGAMPAVRYGGPPERGPEARPADRGPGPEAGAFERRGPLPGRPAERGAPGGDRPPERIRMPEGRPAERGGPPQGPRAEHGGPGPERGGPERGGPERGGPERGGPERGGPERHGPPGPGGPQRP